VKLALICVGGGQGTRFGGDKLLCELGGRPLLEISAAALQAAVPGVPLVIVVPRDRVAYWEGRLASRLADLTVVAGGARRQDSVRHGVEAAVVAGADTVAVHDAARPLIHPDDVRRVVRCAADHGAAVLCRRVTDTVKRVRPDGLVSRTESRDELRLALTPQVMAVSALLGAWARCGDEQEFTDEAAALEAAGIPVQAVEAVHPNPKVTTPQDLAVIRHLWESRS
jgi:2-C-methyl-D-erythritol 4-phosphate cytidylyltransferase